MQTLRWRLYLFKSTVKTQRGRTYSISKNSDLKLGCSGRWTVGHHPSQEACPQPNSPVVPIPPVRHTHRHTNTSGAQATRTCQRGKSRSDLAEQLLDGRHHHQTPPYDGSRLLHQETHRHAANEDSTLKKTFKAAGMAGRAGSPRNAVVGEWDHQIVCRGREGDQLRDLKGLSSLSPQFNATAVLDYKHGRRGWNISKQKSFLSSCSTFEKLHIKFEIHFFNIYICPKIHSGTCGSTSLNYTQQLFTASEWCVSFPPRPKGLNISQKGGDQHTVRKLRVPLQVHQFGNRRAKDVDIQQSDGLGLRR